MENAQNKKFWPVKTTKNGYSCTLEYIQWGKKTWTHSFKALKGKVLLGYTTWEEENPEYVTPEVYATLQCKSKGWTFKVITKAEAVWKD
jgi:hypothetical protein